ncbi:xanthine dehydrogenase family protein molybdopterin-binding subunit [Pseudomonas sp. 5P_3.1_Bac2]|uniref:xanthine dehydrogenase family protein molybdopterin-binding subunit n=1 Tax=Pseudomonas sp. 5P_3.1_Bac2 TaxID=2971617 RepID=UPI0021C98EA4|nr:molybdopterin cofactor-binding domain-containing protein [Pseudomonas sp. 5P_3.1_Bac2]MCU1719173.1 molybdopterin-dependent oxidoreductase [Pseudomonas sp. 5P_3.1_Bac2]
MSRSVGSLSRRQFLVSSGVLVIAACLPVKGLQAKAGGQGSSTFMPNAFVQIGEDGLVTVLSKHSEIGQGVYTAMATLVAEELDADWAQMRVQAAPADVALYQNLTFGYQGTGGSSSVANAYQQMRSMGAMARAMLVQAAAAQWQVPAQEISVEQGRIRHAASAREAGFGQFAAQAARLSAPDPATLTLKNPANFSLIGKQNGVHRIDSLGKTNGSAQFSEDIHEPDMLTVTFSKAPRFGAKLRSFDATQALAVPGVVAVKQVEMGLAVYAKGTWAALQGRSKLKVEWDHSQAEMRSTEEIFAEFRQIAQQPGTVATLRGTPDEALNAADKVLEVEYSFPYVAHAPMEPLGGYLFWDGQSVKARYGCQIQTIDHKQLCALFDLPPEKVEITTILAGGSFGRRIDLGNPTLGPDLVADMAAAAKAIGPGHGIKVVWTREDDVQGGWYRPMVLHRLRGAIRDGKVVAWSNTIAAHSWAQHSVMDNLVVNGIDSMMVEGASEIPYDIEHFRCTAHIVPGKVPTSSLRSVAATHTSHAVECFIDHLLHESGQDPVEGRLTLMDKAPREAGVLRAVAKAANWQGPGVNAGRARGVGVAKAFGTAVAQIVEVSLGEGGLPRVHKVWCAVDCGVVVNPDVVRAQIEGGIGYGLSIALYGNISLKEGVVEQSNFHNYRVLRIDEMPEIEVIIVDSNEAPSGVGELGVPVIAPAVANALALLGLPRTSMSLPLQRLSV